MIKIFQLLIVHLSINLIHLLEEFMISELVMISH